ncbi:MAG TPA: DUF6691 family protein [Bauldia sp.]|nr:DUF6691 family protein [Bauldia sp.]
MRRPFAYLGAALAAGIVFGLGLALSRMTDPQKIKDFLDFAAIPTGGWDPSLAFVMGGGVLVAFVGLRLHRLFRRPLAADAFQHGGRTELDVPLVAGAAIFGVGWGLAGFCPGPAIAALSLIPDQVWLFVAAMVAGSWIAGEVMERGGSGAVPVGLRTADAAAE